MDSRIFLLAGVVLIIAAVSVFFVKSTGDTEAIVTGQFMATSGCMGVVRGTLITDYGPDADMCGSAETYEGKVVEVKGWVYSHKCEAGEECFGGPYMRNVEEIRILD